MGFVKLMENDCSKKLRVGVVGLGKMGLVHASILKVMPTVEVAVLCDKTSLLLKFAAKLFKNTKITKNLDTIAVLNIDTVFVTTPIPSHFPIVKELCSNGATRNLFVEKTLATSGEKAKELCDLVSAYRQINMVGFMKRFAVTFQTAKNFLDEGILGDLVSFEAYAYSSDFSGIEKSLKKSAPRGGVLRDLGSHVLDLSLWFFGDLEVKEVSALSVSDTIGDDSVSLEVETVGLKGKVNISWVMENYRMPEFGFDIRGEKGVMKVNDDFVEVIQRDEKPKKLYRHDLNDYTGFLLGAPEYYREDEYFVRSALAGKMTNPSFLTASKVDLIIDQITQRLA